MKRKQAKQIAEPVKRLIIGYVRVSTDKQGELSLDAQETRIRAAAVSKGDVMDEIITDVQSGKNLNRKHLSRLLERVKGGEVKSIIVCKLDRLTRSCRDLEDLVDMLKEHDVALVSLNETIDTSTAMGMAMVRMIGVFNALERERIGERTSEVLQHLKKKGQHLGRVPYGYTRQKNERDENGHSVSISMLVVNTEEMAVLDRIKALRASGLTLAAIAQSLNTDGLRTRRGSEWQHQYIDAMLKDSQTLSEAA